MKIPFETEKLYYGFPIFLLGYRDETCGYNITTCSSSYSLGNMLVVGIGLKTNAAKKLRNLVVSQSIFLQKNQCKLLSKQVLSAIVTSSP